MGTKAITIRGSQIFQDSRAQFYRVAPAGTFAGATWENRTASLARLIRRLAG